MDFFPSANYSPTSMKVLSIQSHVVSGYVGNRAATFPLQLLGFDVDALNTVQFSNHTGYASTKGYKTTPEQLESLIQGLEENDLGQYDRILTGYIPGAAALEIVRNHIARLKPSIYLLDPVMGDTETGLYVSPDVVPVYRDMLHLANIITPNHFELELLAERKVDSISSLLEAFRSLRERYNLPNIVVSSMALPQDAAHLGSPDSLLCIASSPTSTDAFVFPNLKGYFSGVGDLFSAMVLARYHGDLTTAVAQALHTVQGILAKTSATAGDTMKSRELHIIHNQNYITETTKWPMKHLA